MTRRFSAVLPLSLVFVPVWTSGYVVGKLATQRVDVWSVLVWRFAIGAAVAWLIVALLRAPLPRGRQWLHVGMVGLLLQVGQFGGIYSGLAGGVSAGLTSLAAGMTPLLVGLVAPLVSDEKIGAPQVLGLVLGAVGVVIVLGADVGGGVPWLPLCWTALGVLSLVAGTLYQRRLGTSTAALVPTIAAQNSLSFVVMLPILVLTHSQHAPGSAGGWLATVYLGLVPSIAGFALFYTLLRLRGTTYVSALLNLVPAMTALVSVPLLGEHLTPRIVIGLAIAIVGLYVGVVWNARRNRSGSSGQPSVPRERARVGE